MTKLEESFSSEWSDIIPGARASERAFNGYLNALRADTFYKFVDKWGDTASIEDYRKLADWINVATGRGGFRTDGKGRTAKNIEKAMPLLSTGFFSPRWVLSRIQLPFTAITPVRDSTTGKLRWSPANTEAIKGLASYTTLMMTVMAIAKAAGADVEDDPRSSDYGKVKAGNTRVDLSAGMSQYVRFVAQMITAERKILSNGKIAKVDKGSAIARMLRSKLSPVAGIMASAITGKTFTGDEFIPVGDEKTAKLLSKLSLRMGASKKVSDRIGKTGEVGMRELLPLIVQQTIEGMQVDGIMGGLLSGAGEFVGLGVSSFKPKRKKFSSSRGRTRRRTR